MVAVGALAWSAPGCASPDGVTASPGSSTTATTAPAPGGSAPDRGAATASTTAVPTTAGTTALPPASLTTTTALGGERRHPAYAATSAAMRTRVGTAGGRGYLLVVRDGEVVHEESFGGVRRTTAMPVASTTKWMTATVLMTLVDEGRLSLDDPLSRWLPAFADGDEQLITVRQLLNHTSGIKQQNCIWNLGAVMATCVDQLGSAPLEFRPGSAFSYGNASYHVAGRLIEVITGTDFQTAFNQRLVEPLGLTATTFAPGSRNPSPAAGASTSVEDTARLLEMMQGQGEFRGRRVLTAASVAEIQRNQVEGYDTSRDYAVGITRIPTYGLGTWRDREDGDGNIVVVSGNGALGYYPWIDHEHGTYGVVAVNDQRGAEVAVPASRVVIDAALAASAGN